MRLFAGMSPVPRLGNWVGTQRTNKNRLSPSRKQKLDNLGFIWSVADERWEQGYAALLEYWEENRHVSVPNRFVNQHKFALGKWVTSQRRHKAQLSAERVDRLDRLGFIWDPLTEQWERGYTELLKFKDINGHVQVPKSHKTDNGFALGRWVGTQRLEYRSNKLTRERKARLDKVGFIWEPRK